VPPELKNLHSRQLEILLKAYLACDGSWQPASEGNGYLASTSEQLAEDMGELLIKLGYAVSYRLKTFANPRHRAQSFVHFHRKIAEPVVRAKQNVTREYYRGKVYGAEVANGTVLVRRNGRVTWTGSS
jgi:hypothetical protein